MKIYQVEFTNKKYEGEHNKQIEVDARSVFEAVKKAQTYIESPKIDDFYGVKNWEMVRCELIAETI